ncbi:hypothetical protein BCR33DRAFT_720943 [Rhizoclosmatium globosum]|uniref:G-protein coupled receptors family 1 profile domain-containing protein n=1 Tax=Rhizoclosmatium globosum TaxID=329046 RepID=A0A1Y2BU09_9FUNG|nr:hypothetical protein BCR33DRAFT_720943 [Rhizoclosmatium globosum]|eukprot:ORY38248.1 hypothetical protein BCR33DRAFT_720943 [Rhizoclosmatium globosum]
MHSGKPVSPTFDLIVALAIVVNMTIHPLIILLFDKEVFANAQRYCYWPKCTC